MDDRAKCELLAPLLGWSIWDSASGDGVIIEKEGFQQKWRYGHAKLLEKLVLEAQQEWIECVRRVAALGEALARVGHEQ